jgi:putative transposase
VALTEELQRIQTTVKQQVVRFKGRIRLRQIALDGYFGHNNALQMVRQCDLHLISKLRRDAALYFRYKGPQKSRGPHKRYGQKIDYRNLPEQSLVERRSEDGYETRIYQAELLHREVAQPLNVVILTKTHLQSGAFANVNLFSSDLELGYAELIDRYSLRFQIEFNFRDAKQHWGLEDFMNVKEVPLTNALNLSLFMVNLSQVLLREFRQTHPDGGILDLKAHFRAARYLEETIKWLPHKPEPILLEQIFGRLSGLGRIHDVKVLASSP